MMLSHESHNYSMKQSKACINHGKYASSVVNDRSSYSAIICLDLAKCLQSFGLGDYYQEILDNIMKPMLPNNGQVEFLHRNILDWSVIDVKNWIESLSFLNDNAMRLISESCSSIGQAIIDQLIDGPCFISMNQQQYNAIGISTKNAILLSCIKKGWQRRWSLSTISLNESNSIGLNTTAIGQSHMMRPAMLTIQKNDQEETIYGRLTVIGYKVPFL